MGTSREGSQSVIEKWTTVQSAQPHHGNPPFVIGHLASTSLSITPVMAKKASGSSDKDAKGKGKAKAAAADEDKVRTMHASKRVIYERSAMCRARAA